jgi:hypothetical protein
VRPLVMLRGAAVHRGMLRVYFKAAKSDHFLASLPKGNVAYSRELAAGSRRGALGGSRSLGRAAQPCPRRSVFSVRCQQSQLLGKAFRDSLRSGSWRSLGLRSTLGQPGRRQVSLSSGCGDPPRDRRKTLKCSDGRSAGSAEGGCASMAPGSRRTFPLAGSPGANGEVPVSRDVVALAPAPLWATKGWCDQEVVGTSYREAAIRSLLRGRDLREGVELNLTAHLIPEPDNPADANAVKVVCNGSHVGYLPADIAPLYQPLLAGIIASGFAPEVPAQIWAREQDDWEVDGRGRSHTSVQLHKKVRIDLAEPNVVWAANSPPADRFELLPRGKSITVPPGGADRSGLARYLGSVTERAVYATLTLVLDLEASKTRQLVEVAVDGQSLGRLTPRMSEELAPALTFLNDRRLIVVARCHIRGNALKTDVVLHLARATGLDSAWLDSVANRVLEQPAGDRRPGPGAAVATEATVQIGAAAGEPQPGWQPAPEWPPAPPDWHFWVGA